jgi:hypothetical protein
MDMDANRAQDGIDLRYRFAYEKHIDRSVISAHLENMPCSMLEMMIALALRCEESIMDDPEYGDRTGTWFWEMIENMGLYCMNDHHYDKEIVENTINDVLNRRYERDGRGGFFHISDSPRDLRNEEIWYQMCWYLNTIL